ncbi:MAG: copper amine oxidase N-terminal domain-containing protein [Peptococcaceae bacterium]|nr:copper amine oxidase N-terminal domain-containing protein [Peptococcaceae bacterium]
MKNKKLVTLALATALTVSAFTPAFANPVLISEAPAADAVIVSQEEQAMQFAKAYGTVQEVNEQESYILVQTAEDSIRFNIDTQTWLMDGQTGFPITLAELEGKEVAVSHSMAMTMSLPAQSYAYAVITKGDVMPNYAVIEAVTETEDGIRLTTENGGMWATVAKDAQVSPFRTRNIVTTQDLQPGAQVVLYYDVVAMSYPGQAFTDRVVLLQPADAVQAEAAAPAENEMVNLREAVSGLGLDILWDAEGQTVTLQKGAFTATVVINDVNYGINKMLVREAQAAEIRDGRTYVPQSFVDAVKEALN